MADGAANNVDKAVDDPARLAALAGYRVLDTKNEREYDDIVQLAAILCDAPVALVSLVDRDRQWFKARVGFDSAQTDIGSAVCAHALLAPDLLVIPDLADDPRTAANPLVTGDPHIRFYAGAPLRTPAGQVVGSLCVIDTKPRPAGLTEPQANGLRALGREVIALLELRRMVAERDAALRANVGKRTERALNVHRDAATEAHWRALFEQASEGFAVGEVVRDAEGRGTDWRFVDVNPAWSVLTGIARADAVGRTASEVISHVDAELIAAMIDVTDTGVPMSFTDQIGNVARWYDGRVFKVGTDRFGVLFVEVTDRIRAEARQAALLEIGDHLRSFETVGEMTSFASRLVGRALNLSRAGFGRIDPATETIEIEPDWTRPGVPSIAGRHRFADYGDLLEPLLAGDALVIEDARTSPRTAANPRPMLDAGIVALVNMPVRERDRTVAAFLVHDDKPRAWPPEDLEFLRSVADRLEFEVVRLGAEERRRLLNQELSHRLKNTLAMVQAIASQTLKPVTERDAVQAFDRRLTALGAAHDVLVRESWSAAPLAEVMRSVLDTAGQDGNVHLDGPDIRLGPRAVLSTSLLVHELATNAAKYGALSVPAGQVNVRWRTQGKRAAAILSLEWVESGGPRVETPSRRGFGSRLISLGLLGTGGVDLRYNRSGLQATMTAPMSDLTQD